ncbi:MAG: hypothetical protein PVJ43_09435 [Gemmatimonadales bacterium]|jgi:hypothetical protein
MNLWPSSLRWLLLTLSLSLALGSEAAGQLLTPSARSQGMASAYSAVARGYESSFWNPANLGLPDRPRWSVGLASASANLNNNALTYGQINDLYGRFLDDATKSKLLADVRSANADELLELDFGVGGSVLGFSVGRFGFGLGTRAAGRGDVNADALELVLFGNDGESGEGKDFELSGSRAHAWWLSGGHISYAQPFAIALAGDASVDFSIGASFRYAVMHAYYRFDDLGSLLTSEPLALDASAELLESKHGDAGRVWGFDLGIAARWEGLVAGVAVENMVADVAWNLENFDLTLYSVESDFERTITLDSTTIYRELDAADRERLEDLARRLGPPRRLRLGVAYPVAPKVLLAADYYEVLSGRMRNQWDRSFAVGGEFTWVRRVPLRAGVASDFSELSLTVGAGLRAGILQADLAVGRWGLARGEGAVVALSIALWPGGSR